jgi:hypothetical protein
VGKRIALTLITLSLLAFTAAPAGATLPNSNIKLNRNGVAVYKPTSQQTGWSGTGTNTATLTTDASCDATNEQMTITNKTPVAQSVTSLDHGGILGTVAAGQVVGVCTWGVGVAQLHFGLVNSSAGSGKRSLTLYVS